VLDVTGGRTALSRKNAIESLSHAVAQSIAGARQLDAPFFHLQFDKIFPEETYEAMLRTMPKAADYRPMHGRSRDARADGTPTRVKIDLFPEYIRHLPSEKHAVWSVVGAALCSAEVKRAFMARLRPALIKRFGEAFEDTGLYPIPILTRDITGYRIFPHTDTHWKGITVQLYLPRDESNVGIGTIFHRRLLDGSLPKETQMRFAPNTGYAFVVDRDTWHSADPVGPEVETRDSILLTYFVDAGPLRFLRNRGKRFSNFLVNEGRNLIRWGA